jgi:anti-anti-sigma factor
LFNYELLMHGDKSAVVCFHGELDIDATEIFEDDLTPQLLEFSVIKLNFSDVHFVDSSGIGLLISLINHLKQQNIQVGVINLQDDVKQIFLLLQLPEILGEEVFVDLKSKG